MTDEARRTRNAYKREWNKRNADKVKEYQAKYWEKKSEQSIIERSKLARNAGKNRDIT